MKLLVYLNTVLLCRGNARIIYMQPTVIATHGTDMTEIEMHRVWRGGRIPFTHQTGGKDRPGAEIFPSIIDVLLAKDDIT